MNVRMTEISDETDGLFSMKLKKNNGFSDSNEYGFQDSSKLREWLSKDRFLPDWKYSLFETVGNPEIDTLLKSEAGKEQGDRFYTPRLLNYFQDCVYAKLNGTVYSEESGMMQEIYNKCRGVHLELPRVEYRGYHSWPHFEDFLWPRTHVLEGSLENMQAKMKEAVDFLLSREAFEYLARKDAPQDYLKKEFEAIYRQWIPPILLWNKQAELTGRELKVYLDFLAPFTYASRRTNWNEMD